MNTMPAQPRQTPWGLIVGIIIVLLLVAAAAYAYMMYGQQLIGMITPQQQVGEQPQQQAQAAPTDTPDSIESDLNASAQTTGSSDVDALQQSL